MLTLLVVHTGTDVQPGSSVEAAYDLWHREQSLRHGHLRQPSFQELPVSEYSPVPQLSFQQLPASGCMVNPGFGGSSGGKPGLPYQ